jgi:hypothetical protein
MRANVAGLCLSLILGAAATVAQEAPIASTQGVPPPTHPNLNTVYCSGFYSSEKVPDDLRLVSGEQSEYKVTFTAGNYVYLSKGANQGVKVGDKFSVVRAEEDPIRAQWFKWQEKLAKAMGTHYSDLGTLEVVKAHPDTAIARISFSCAFMQRGDIVRPWVERPAGEFKDSASFDPFAPVSGKPVAMVVRGKDAEQATGRGATVYVNLGTAQGVKVGDYFRIFRYQGSRSETIPVEKDYQDRMYGFGSNPRKYTWNDLPREVLGEGIVLNASQNSSTMLITAARSEVYSGDYVEIE